MKLGVPGAKVLAVIAVGSLIASEQLLKPARANAVETAPPRSAVSSSPERRIAMESAARNYERYCALCHGDGREGYKNDGAPSLKSASLFGGTLLPLVMTAAYGRPGTPMGPYLKDMGGPMTLGEIRDLVGWLMVQANARFAPSRPEELAPVRGDTRLGKQIYERNCKSCHGTKGEGGGGKIRGTALGNTAMLSVTPDSFIQRAIVQGRQNTNMPSWAEKLTDHEIDSTVAFLRTRAKGWTAGFRVIRKPPAPENYVLNAAGRDPVFRLSDGRYVMADELRRALAEKRKMVVLDTRVPYFWAMANIPGSVPIPYYSNFDSVIANLPTDGTWIVAYCECPRAEADQVVTELRKRGFDHTAVLWEGYGGWTAKGFPIEVAKVN